MFKLLPNEIIKIIFDLLDENNKIKFFISFKDMIIYKKLIKKIKLNKAINFVKYKKIEYKYGLMALVALGQQDIYLLGEGEFENGLNNFYKTKIRKIRKIYNKKNKEKELINFIFKNENKIIYGLIKD